ncbi:MAG TPA: sigma-70 family RNA polymerase sigma factor [Devosia sp.]|jgi:RNA polymerase sigma-70 factor (ECF subfamily)|uniref:sigma-70 family RNA polymerase sigma factor n=1 Tax=Devosia sp. TaxID=1871048 RepID=UPI002DDDB05B|nr:sigma-70 family RNA polymerase sigma factor [Devosia sp.]HEV2514562.1 sigma-70 family RNA polymerase sigma factor [Devosia sp.]
MDFLDEIEATVPALRRYARALTRNADRADDLVQDCLERAIRKRSLFTPTGPLQAWLFRILINLWRNDLRFERRRGDHLPIDSLVSEPSVAAPQPGRIALAEMSRAIDRLPDDQREALLLVVIEGTSYQDAADILGIPAGTLMSRLGRARAALRTLTGSGEEPRLRSVK